MAGNDDGGSASRALADHLAPASADAIDGAGAEEATRRHALEQLVESRLGGDLTAAARRLAAADGAADGEGLRAAADELGEAPSFRALQGVAEGASSHLSAIVGNNSDVATSKKAKVPAAAAAPAPAPAATSFSLFDMLDAQKGAFALPPRITAQKVIDAHAREQNTESAGDAPMAEGEDSALGLLEKADDMEDVSPDPEAWEEVRKILYEGLTLQSDGGGQSRYLKVHQSLSEKCRGNPACNPQMWGLAQNLVGSLLALSNDMSGGRGNADLCWDIAHSLLELLSHLALDLVTSAVGNEPEVERMFLAMCMILASDASACIMGMMEPMAGSFEVWARLVDPGRVMTIVRPSGLGGVALRRCGSRGKTASSEVIWKMAHSAGSGDSLADIEHCNFLQSLSVLRTLLFKCGGSEEVVSLIHDQFTGRNGELMEASSTLLSCGMASTDQVEGMLNEIESKQKQKGTPQNQAGVHGAANSVLKPFHDVLKLNETDKMLAGNELRDMCSQTILLIQAEQ
ncbi:hypothetical protein ACHAXT_004958 [Thalassiosira profunda]